MVELEVLLLAGCVDLSHGPTGMSVSSHKSLREIADSLAHGEPKEAAASLRQHEISKLTTVNGTSTFRILFTLQRVGYVWRDPVTQKYQLGVRLAEAAPRATSTQALVHVARAHLARLRDLFNETVNLGILQNDQVFYLEVLESTNPFRLALPAGSRAPVHSTALGKAIAAFLPPQRLRAMLDGYKFMRLTPSTTPNREAFIRSLARVRRRGYSLDREETTVGASCVATPILDASGHS